MSSKKHERSSTVQEEELTNEADTICCYCSCLRVTFTFLLHSVSWLSSYSCATLWPPSLRLSWASYDRSNNGGCSYVNAYFCYGLAIGHYKWRYNATSSVDPMHATMQLLLFLVQNLYLLSENQILGCYGIFSSPFRLLVLEVHLEIPHW